MHPSHNWNRDCCCLRTKAIVFNPWDVVHGSLPVGLLFGFFGCRWPGCRDSLVTTVDGSGFYPVVSTVSSAASVFILPVLWVISAGRPVSGAWVSVSIVFFGTALVFIEVDALNLCNLCINLGLFRL